MIELKNITKIYQMGDETVYAVDNLSLTIDENAYIAIVGASGSGKSTLMNIIGCLDVAEEGSYIFRNHNIEAYSDNRLADIRNRQIGFVFQQYHLLQRLTALENVELPLIYQGMSSSKRKACAREALERVGLALRMHHRPNQLSGGQQQRVAIARALSTKPALLLADEPTGNLDSKSGEEIMHLFDQLSEQGNTILVVTHDDKIAKRARRVIRLVDGSIVSDTALTKGRKA